MQVTGDRDPRHPETQAVVPADRRWRYSVSNRGPRSGLIGTPDQIAGRLRDYEQAGVGLMLQFSPQREEMARFGRDVITPWRS